jgi:hypothetical protein
MVDFRSVIFISSHVLPEKVINDGLKIIFSDSKSLLLKMNVLFENVFNSHVKFRFIYSIKSGVQ